MNCTEIILAISNAVLAFASATTLIILFWQRSKNTNIDKCSYLLKLDKYFVENETIKKIYKILSDNHSCPENCSFEGTTSAELSAYLTLLENLNILIKKKVLSKEEVYDLFGHRIFSMLHNKYVQDTEIKIYSKHYKNLFMLHKTLFIYCIKKAKNIPHIDYAECFTKENGSYKEGYNKHKNEIEDAIEKYKAKKIPVKKNDTISLPNSYYIAKCCINDYSVIAEIQNKIVENLQKNKNDKLFIPTENDKIQEFLKREDIFFICTKTPDDIICAYSYTFFSNDVESDLSNYFTNKKVATFDTVVVLPDFRGNKLHDKLLKFSIEEAKKRSYNIMAATVSPDNIYSMNNFIKNNFQVKTIIEKSKSYKDKRYVVYKNLI